MPRKLSKVKAEHCARLDVYYLRRQGMLTPGRYSTLTWSWANGGGVLLSAQIFAQCDRLIVTCGSPQEIELERTPCHYGGSRPWLICPNCGGRAAVLYLRGTTFRCRACAMVAYASTCEDALDRAWRRQQKIEGRIGKPGAAKPKWMHWSTFERLRDERMRCEMKRDDLIVQVGRTRFPEFFGGSTDAPSAKPHRAARNRR